MEDWITLARVVRPRGNRGEVLADSLSFNTHLSGNQEVMPTGIVNNSLAQGQANFKLSADGTELHYKLIAANIDNAFMAHIHLENDLLFPRALAG